ncbi:carbohydrate sulfotransferase 15-like [Sinocyclocheilus grahami]|uniref:carbohydrate sulfotransferase 15-like n=1 Tax=Sinocyclocheilus grahami TaxID=75366 RepID=UPI0007AD475E|nr:PREDICTED: carbohydrate sulfotransferase 15-like [Sinocyclocheilus grahami]
MLINMLDERHSHVTEPLCCVCLCAGIIRSSDRPHTRFPLDHYLDLFDPVALQIQQSLLGNSSSNIITSEASASTMWDNNAWLYLHGNSTGAEPPSLVQDFIHALQPDARFIAILRDPVERSEVTSILIPN